MVSPRLRTLYVKNTVKGGLGAAGDSGIRGINTRRSLPQVCTLLVSARPAFRAHSTDTMKSVAFLSLLAAATAEYISVTCRNLALDPTTEVLSGECNDGQGDHAAWQPTALDLNTCLAYDAIQGRILVGRKPPAQVFDGQTNTIIVARQRQLRRSMRWLLPLPDDGPDLGRSAAQHWLHLRGNRGLVFNR